MPLRIMIVEDEEPLLELLRYNFECAGYAVDTLGDGTQVEATWKRASRTSSSSIGCCRRPLRDRAVLAAASPARHQRLPLMMLTARCEEHDRARAIKAGADDYMVKPFSVSDWSRASRRCWTGKDPEKAEGATEPA